MDSGLDCDTFNLIFEIEMDGIFDRSRVQFIRDYIQNSERRSSWWIASED
ncbi:hypothetical protein LEP1GSC193_1362 [Leptospira alstonii serovar Pingchang str. 80-412]|uniref:Uncharacterized protein n=2 Tax=Leptospira alstonii TaxID=28452 RepID=M6CQ21_9LEPT|nr:hypothetical protein LEP1GSC194_1288 [Leptospira alstonii serovar Sichuan str. 79601]EQA81863.1 hypothetical protein LEP1GSC193_1362 [Leptospira alstonii serovar Pingchang str. 80-412]